MASHSRIAAVADAQDGHRLDRVAAQLFGGDWSRNRISGWIREGRLQVDGEPWRKPGARVAAGQTLVLEPPLPEVPVPGGPLEPQVLHEDAALVVLDKPPGLPMHGNSPGDPRPSVAHWLVERYGGGLPIAQGAERPGVVHRLDRDTSGVCVAALRTEAFEDLMAQFAERSVEKEYRALCYGRPRFRSDWIDRRLVAHPRRPGRVTVTNSTDEGTRDALTYWEVEERFAGFALLRVRPRTGRKHQVRVHLTSEHMPIVGDPLYRARNFGLGMLPPGAPPVERTLLHASRIAFEHPEEGGVVRFGADLPEAMAAVVDALRAEAPPEDEAWE